MQTLNTHKRKYTAPLIEQIQLDNEISLILESTPPFGPDEFSNNVSENFNNDPFNNNLS